MRNQRGLTLVEVLATITISSVILGIGFMLLSSVNGMFNNSIQKSNDNTSINTVLNTISREMADPVAIYLATLSELRFKTFDNRYMVLLYNQTDRSLSLAKSANVDPNAVQDITAASFPTLSPAKVLATNLTIDANNSGAAFIVRDSNNFDLTLTTGLLTQANGYNSIKIWLNFEISRTTPTGVITRSYQPFDISVALSLP